MSLGEHYLRQLAHVLAMRIEHLDDIGPRQALLYRAVGVRYDECEAAGEALAANKLLAEARRQRAEKQSER